MATPLHKNPCPRGHEIFNFVIPFHGHQNYILILSVLCLGVDTIFEKIMHFHYMLIPCDNSLYRGRHVVLHTQEDPSKLMLIHNRRICI